jgi:sigma-B regulation protein RsbU (phosphoserine phosphatase)
MQDKILENLEYQIQFQEFKINSLLEITAAINTSQDIGHLLGIFNYILNQQLSFSKIIFFHLEESGKVLLKTGVKGKINEDLLFDNIKRFTEITTIDSSENSIINQFETIIPVFHAKKPLAYLLLSSDRFKKLTTKELLTNLSFIQTLANITLVAIENKRMLAQNIKQARLKKELEFASEMQKLLFPSELPSNSKVDISAKYTSRHQIGGDYYDYIPLSETEFIVCIGDVSGKGITAGMIMTNFQATIRTLFSYQDFELDFLIEELNKKVISISKGEKFITFFIAKYNHETRKLMYVNAGHNQPFITNGKEFHLLDKGTVGLGMFDDLPFLTVGTYTVAVNETLVMYTDGIIELENEKNQFFELDQLIQLTNHYYPLKMEDLNNIIFSKLLEWKGKRNFVDDTAIFTCRFF